MFGRANNERRVDKPFDYDAGLYRIGRVGHGYRWQIQGGGMVEKSNIFGSFSMKRVDVFCRLAASLAVVASFLFVGGVLARQNPPLEHRECVEDDCGVVSKVCWTPNHMFGGTNCTYCTGSQIQDLCQRADGPSCSWTGDSQSCGVLIVGGTCTGTGKVGVCVGGVAIIPPQNCSVPMC